MPVQMLEERTLLVIPKNSATEQHVSAKATAGSKGPNRYFEIREMWFKDGPTEPPIPTKKGTMIHRSLVARVINAILNDMQSGEIVAEDMAELRRAVERLSRGAPGGDQS